MVTDSSKISDTHMVEEILQYLEPNARMDLKLIALTYFNGISAHESTGVVQQFSRNNFAVLEKLSVLLLHETSTVSNEVNRLILEIFVNVSVGNSDALMFFLNNYTLMDRIIELCGKPDEENFVLAVKFLVNVTRTKNGAEAIFERLRTNAGGEYFALGKFTELFVARRNASVDVLGYLLLNLTQVLTARKWLVISGQLTNILTLLKHEAVVPRHSAVEIFKNCCFETDLHAAIVGIPDLLAQVLFPLIGPEELPTDDNDQLPIDLQFMDAGKQREPVSSIREKLLEALYQLCATKVGREYLRNNGTYIVLREYHQWETQTECDLLCGNIIGVLIRTEDEIGAENIKALDVASDKMIGE